MPSLHPLALDRLDNHQDWLKTKTRIDHDKYQSAIFNSYFSGISNNHNKDVLVNQRVTSGSTSNKIITRRDRDLQLLDNKILSCKYNFYYNTSDRSINIEISNINNLYCETKYNIDSIRILLIGNIYCNNKGHIIISYIEPTKFILLNEHDINLRLLHENLLQFIDDIESILGKKHFMSARQIKRLQHSKQKKYFNRK